MSEAVRFDGGRLYTGEDEEITLRLRALLLGEEPEGGSEDGQ